MKRPQKLKFHRNGDTIPISLPKCFGLRAKAWQKCESCPVIVTCSKKTLRDRFGARVNIIGPHGESPF